MEQVQEDAAASWQNVKDSARSATKRVKDKVMQSKAVQKSLEASKKLEKKVTEVRRRVITGNREKRVRDYVLEVPVVRTLDKFSFTIGIIVLMLSEAVLLLHPEIFYWWYIIVMTPLMVARAYFYHKLKYLPFMLDFCYYCQWLVATSGFFGIGTMQRCAFYLTHGPLAFANIIWKSSLVFHDLEKITSVFLHIYPTLVTYVWRWNPDSEGNAHVEFEATWTESFFQPLLAYMVWQTFYVAITEVGWVAQKIRSDKTMFSSIRWLAGRKQNRGLAPLVKTISCKVGIMEKDESFDPESWKTKFLFMGSQLIYSILTLLPGMFLASSRWVNDIYLAFIIFMICWNGAGFYIEVFSSSYNKKLQELSAKHDMAIHQIVQQANTDKQKVFEQHQHDSSDEEDQQQAIKSD